VVGTTSTGEPVYSPKTIFRMIEAFNISEADEEERI
jgi:hypothetical protein